MTQLPVVQVRGRHKITDSCSWKYHDPSAKAVQQAQVAFDALLDSDRVLRGIVHALRERSCKAVVIGGWLRDQLIRYSGSKIESRDIDFVVQCTDGKSLDHNLPTPDKRTFFGGLTFAHGPLGIDLWALEETFLFTRFNLDPTFSNVIAVTDFGVNAALFYPRQFWQQPSIVDGGCFDAIMRQEIEFHFEWLPIPIVQVARLVHLSSKSGFSLGAGAKSFIRETCVVEAARNEVLANLDQNCPESLRARAKEILRVTLALGRTRYFSNCLGVFEGGGVRAAAFAGAYSAAVEAGIAFNKISGTSGGSIAAAFIATGAHPDRVSEELFTADLSKLAQELNPREVLGRSPRRVKRVARLFTWSNVRKLLTLDLYGGLHGSDALERWIDGALHRLLASRGLRIGSRAVTFADLPIPLFVIASDVANNRPQVWSRGISSGVSVAFSVRCSCSIPFFFQPVRGEGGSVYVDGGILSNTPAFVFLNEQANDLSRYAARVLAFRLIKAHAGQTDTLGSVGNLITAVANTIVDGASHLQRGLQPSVYAIDIDTGDIGSTDFDKINDEQKRNLFDSGKRAVQSFVAEERSRVFAVNVPSSFVGRDQKMLLFVQSLNDCKREIIFLDENSHWLYLIFPAFLAATRRGVRLCYVTKQSNAHDPAEAYRQRLLTGLGANVIAQKTLPFRGFVADGNSMLGAVAVTEATSAEDLFEHETTRVYSATSDPTVVRKLYAEVSPLTEGHLWQDRSKSIDYNNCSEEQVFSRLRGVSHYADATFAFEEVSLDEKLLALQSHVKEFKYLQIDWLIRDFLGHNINLFAPQEIVLANGTRTIITPPVVEACGGIKVVIEGHTRAFHCLRSGRQSFAAIVVSDVDSALPTKTQRFLDLAVASRTIDIETQFGKIDKRLWRDIEGNIHPTTD